jgi:membrane protease YdiL (CAAX protease family)
MLAKDRLTWAFILLILILVICNLAFKFSNGWSRIGWQLFGYGSLIAVYKIAGLSLADIGLSRIKLGSGLKYGLVFVGIIALVFMAVYFINQSVFKDSRYNQGLITALKAGLFTVPFKTVVFEELAFRGIMPAVLKELGGSLLVIFIVTSLLFGLWHIATAPVTATVGPGHIPHILVVTGVFAVTSAGGAVFYWLRYQSGSLIAPVIVHWFINGSAILLAALSWDRS